jgi:copper chaperone CopZ
MKKLLLALALANLSTPAFAAGATVKVKGLVCDFCVQAINKTFRKRAEVRALKVDLDAKEIRLDFKPGRNLDDATITKLVTDTGYNVVAIARTGA